MDEETFVIVGADGAEHEFPVGLDPKKAAGIVRQQEAPAQAREQALNRPAEYGAQMLGNVGSDAKQTGLGLLDAGYRGLTTAARATGELGGVIGGRLREMVGLNPNYPTLDNIDATVETVKGFVPAMVDHYSKYLDSDERALQVRDHPVETVLDVAGITGAVKAAKAPVKAGMKAVKATAAQYPRLAKAVPSLLVGGPKAAVANAAVDAVMDAARGGRAAAAPATVEEALGLAEPRAASLRQSTRGSVDANAKPTIDSGRVARERIPVPSVVAEAPKPKTAKPAATRAPKPSKPVDVVSGMSKLGREELADSLAGDRMVTGMAESAPKPKAPAVVAKTAGPMGENAMANDRMKRLMGGPKPAMSGPKPATQPDVTTTPKAAAPKAKTEASKTEAPKATETSTEFSSKSKGAISKNGLRALKEKYGSMDIDELYAKHGQEAIDKFLKESSDSRREQKIRDHYTNKIAKGVEGASAQAPSMLEVMKKIRADREVKPMASHAPEAPKAASPKADNPAAVSPKSDAPKPTLKDTLVEQEVERQTGNGKKANPFKPTKERKTFRTEDGQWEMFSTGVYGEPVKLTNLKTGETITVSSLKEAQALVASQ